MVNACPIKCHSPGVYSSSAVFRSFLWMQWLCDYNFGVVTSSCIELSFGGSSAFLRLSEYCYFAFCFLQGFVYWTVNVSHSAHKPPVSCACKETTLNGDRCLPKMSDPSVCSYNTIALSSLIWHLLVWPRLDFSPSLTAYRRWFAEKMVSTRRTRKQKQYKQSNHLPPSSHSHKLISDDQDLVKDTRSDISFRITSYVNRSPAVRQSGANFSNLISITTQDIHGSTRHFQSSIKVLCFSSQSCRQIATDIHEMI